MDVFVAIYSVEITHDRAASNISIDIERTWTVFATFVR